MLKRDTLKVYKKIYIFPISLFEIVGGEDKFQITTSVGNVVLSSVKKGSLQSQIRE